MPRHEVSQHLEHFGAQWDQDSGVVQLIALGIKSVGAKHIEHSDPFLREHGTTLATGHRCILHRYYEKTTKKL